MLLFYAGLGEGAVGPPNNLGSIMVEIGQALVLHETKAKNRPYGDRLMLF